MRSQKTAEPLQNLVGNVRKSNIKNKAKQFHF